MRKQILNAGILGLAYLFFLSDLYGQLTVYTWPTGEGEALVSDKYRVYVTHGSDEETEVPVLMSNAIYSGDYREDYLKGRTFSFAQVSYDAEAGEGLTFRVEKLFGNASSSVVLSPESYGLEPALAGDGKEVSFQVTGSNRYISVNFKGSDNTVVVTSDNSWIKHMLCIFVDPAETGIPSKTGEGVVVYAPETPVNELQDASLIYIPAGYHNLEDYQSPGTTITDKGKITLKGNQSLYLEGGAFVEGNIETSGNNVKIFGRGILSMRQYKWKNSADYDGYDAGYIIHLGNNSIVQGIMCMEAPWHGIVGGAGNLIEDIKYLGWHSNNDGIRVGSGSEIRNSFLRAVDDDFYNFNIYVHDMVIWKGHNGSIMTYGWGGSNTYNSGSSLMENVDVINPEWTGLGNNNGLIMSQTAYDYKPYDYNTGSTITTFRNIRIEGNIPGLVNVKCFSGDLPQVNINQVGYLGDLVLDNITVNHQFDRGLLQGATDVATTGDVTYYVQDVTFNDVTINGECLTEENKGQFILIGPNTTRDLFFKGCNTTGINIVFIRPVDGDELIVGDSISVEAEITDADGSITGAELYINDSLVGEKSGPPFLWEDYPELENIQVGDYVLKIVATDDSSNQFSRTAGITVTPLPNVENLMVLVRSDTSLLLQWDDVISGETGFLVERSPAGIDQYEVVDTVMANDTSYLDTGLEDFTLYAYRLRTLYPETTTQPTDPLLGRPSITEQPVLPDPWDNYTFGDTLVAMAGTGWFENDTFTIDAGDGDFWTETDRGHFIGQPVSGDCEIMALLTDYTHAQSYSMAGVMIRDSLEWGSRFATSFMISSKGPVMRDRVETNGTVNQQPQPGTMETAPYWVRLKREGDVFSAFSSPDRIRWVMVRDPVTIPMTGNVYIGLAATSHTTASPGIYSFTRIYTGLPHREYTLTATSGPGGSVSPSGKLLVLEGSTMEYSITANTGYQVADVLVDDVSQDSIGSYTFSEISANHTIRALFSKIVSSPDQPETSSVRIWPNPADDRLTIEIDNPCYTEVCLYDIHGKELIRQTGSHGSFRMETAEYPPGLYILNVQQGNKQTVHKVIIE